MKYIVVTHVDSVTGIPGYKEPMRKGPVYPDVKDLNIEWWDASHWPIEHPGGYPRFYGTCDDDADLNVPGVVHVFEDDDHDGTAKEQYDRLWNQELKARLPSVATPRQIRLALLDAGLLDSVQTALDDLQEPLRSRAQIEWEYAEVIEKNSALVQKLYRKLGLTEDELDDLFVASANISSKNLDKDDEDTSESDGDTVTTV